MDGIKMAKLDFYTIKPQAIAYIFVTLVILVMFSFMSPSYEALGITCAWVIPLFTSALFQVQEKDSLDRLYGTLSVKQKDVVRGRYLSVIAMYALAMAMSLIVYGGFTLYHGTTVSGESLVWGISVSVLLFSFFMGIQTPIYFQVGYTKGKIISLIPFFIVASIVVLVILYQNPSMAKVVSFVQDNQLAFVVGFIVLSSIILFVSYQAALVSYKKREQ